MVMPPESLRPVTRFPSASWETRCWWSAPKARYTKPLSPGGREQHVAQLPQFNERVPHHARGEGVAASYFPGEAAKNSGQYLLVLQIQPCRGSYPLHILVVVDAHHQSPAHADDG